MLFHGYVSSILRQLQQVFHRLSQTGLQLNLTKCDQRWHEVMLLGHQVMAKEAIHDCILSRDVAYIPSTHPL